MQHTFHDVPEESFFMQQLDFVEYHRHTLPALLAEGRAALLKGKKLPVLGLSVSGQPISFSYRCDNNGVEIIEGTREAELCVELSPEDWAGMVADIETVPGILYGDRLLQHSGDMMDFVRWEPGLRALYTGRPIYDAAGFELRQASGRALDPLTPFTLHDDAQDMREFLDAAGYLLVKDVFSIRELASFRVAAKEMAAGAKEGDQQSWWGKNANGEAVLCRCLNAGSHGAFSALYDDARMQQLASLLPPGMVHPKAEEQDAITVVYKSPGVTEGLADLPWHRDCGMGGHANMCPTYVLSIYLYDASPAQGPLQFLPGSHHYGFGFADATEIDFPAAVTVPAQAGDITLHIGDVMHAAPPPLSDNRPYRQSVLLAFHPDFKNHRGERHYNDALLGAEDGQVSHLRTLVKD